MRTTMTRRLSPLAVTVLMGWACVEAAPDPGDTILFENGVVLALDEAASVHEAFAVRGNRILAVGSAADVGAAAGDRARKIDLDGRVVVPGFIDPHVHTASATQMGILEDVGLTRFSSVEDALDHMIEKGSEAGPDEWLLFTNIDFGTQTSETDALTAEMLDRVSIKNPVFVLHAGGHISSANTRMLETMGVTADTPDPPAGGEFGRLADGSPNGVMYGAASLLALERIEPYQEFDLAAGLDEQSDAWLAAGLVTLGDAGVGAARADELDQLLDLAASGVLHQRVRAYLSQGQELMWRQQGVRPGHGNERVRVVGYKLSADGSNQARTGLQREPYPGTDSRGIAYLTEDQLYDAFVAKTNEGFQLAMHGNGDAAIDNIIRAVSRAEAEGTPIVRPRIEHCSIVQDDQLAELSRLGISCSFLIGHVYLWGSAFRNSVFGQEKAELLDRTGSFEAADIPYSLHSDAAVTTFTPLEMMEIAVTRTLYAEPDYVLAPDERASRLGALRGITSTAAWQLLSEEELGSIEPGKFADFVILAGNPMDVPADQIGEIEVLETWVDGVREFPGS